MKRLQKIKTDYNQSDTNKSVSNLAIDSEKIIITAVRVYLLHLMNSR